jgi:hypothetical protein
MTIDNAGVAVVVVGVTAVTAFDDADEEDVPPAFDAVALNV